MDSGKPLPGNGGFLRWLFASEPLPPEGQEPPASPRPESGGFSLPWLIAAEDLDASEEDRNNDGGARPV